MEAHINDHQTQEIDVMLIQEPSMDGTAGKTHVNHSAWRLYRPTLEVEGVRLRSLIYVSKNSTSSHGQITAATLASWQSRSGHQTPMFFSFRFTSPRRYGGLHRMAEPELRVHRIATSGRSPGNRS